MINPIRILHVVTHMERGGLETMLMNYYRNIDRTKVQFDFIVHRSYESAYDKEIEFLGGKIFRVSKLIPWSYSYKNKLKQIFREHPEYSIIHVHQDCLSSVALKCAKDCGIQVRIAHSHNNNQDKNLKYCVKRFYMRSIPKYATHLFACSQEAGNWMFNGKKYVILNNAIESNKFTFDRNKRNEIRKKLNFLDELVIGHVGRFNYQKNHDFIIDIFNEVYKNNQNVKLMLVGTGILKKTIQDKIKKLSLEDNVIILENRDDVNQLMQAMDVFVFPSHYEGLGIVAVEAQATGLLVIKSDNVPEQCVVTPNVISMSLNDSAENWAKQILHIVENFERKDTCEMIKKSGYDIGENAKWLQEFYLKEVKKYE